MSSALLAFLTFADAHPVVSDAGRAPGVSPKSNSARTGSCAQNRRHEAHALGRRRGSSGDNTPCREVSPRTGRGRARNSPEVRALTRRPDTMMPKREAKAALWAHGRLSVPRAQEVALKNSAALRTIPARLKGFELEADALAYFSRLLLGLRGQLHFGGCRLAFLQSRRLRRTTPFSRTTTFQFKPNTGAASSRASWTARRLT
jgi:hypothetical protein